MLDLKILVLLFREEFRLQASFFNRSYFLTSSLVTVLFTFVMGISLPLLRRAVAIDDMLTAAHWVMLFYGFGVGGFALFGDRILERRFGSISLLLGSSYTLPIRHRRLFLLFYIKDTLYYIFFTILPMIVGLLLASVLVVHIALSSLLMLFISLTLSFLLGISFCVMLFSLMVRWGHVPVLIFAAAAGTYFAFRLKIAGLGFIELPSLSFYHSRSLPVLSGIIITVLFFVAVSFFTIKETPAPHERRAPESYRRWARLMSVFASGYNAVLAKDAIDLVRSGMIFPVVFTFLVPLIFLYAVTWFLESVMLWNLGFSLLFYAAMVGFFCTLLYSWLSNIDISECYNSLPLSMTFVIRTKLILFFGLTAAVAVPYLLAVGYLRSEMYLIWPGLFILFTVSAYVGSAVSYLTGLFTNSYLLDAKVLLMFASAVVPALVAETLLSFYYQINAGSAIIYIAGLGILLIAVSILFQKKLDEKWKGKMFRIA